MKTIHLKITPTIFFLILNLFVFAKKPDTDKILKEGQLLYRLEKASWYGTDDYLIRFKDRNENTGGYLSYLGEKNMVYTIFFNKNNPDQIIVRYQFDSLPQKDPISIDTINHNATELEKELILIRQDATQQVINDEDNFFSFYKNTSYNFIPLITPKERKVIILTGTNSNEEVLLGNDYVLKYNKKNKFIKKQKIHNSLIRLPNKMKAEDSKAMISMHSHVISDLIDPTDICTLLLYKDFVDWKQHYVISQKYLSIFDMEKEVLVILTTKQWKHMYENMDNKKSQ